MAGKVPFQSWPAPERAGAIVLRGAGRCGVAAEQQMATLFCGDRKTPNGVIAFLPMFCWLAKAGAPRIGSPCLAGDFRMANRARPMLAAFVCCGLLASSGCTRTSDGSIEFQRLSGLPDLFGSRPPVSGPLTPFPPVPPAPAPIAAAQKRPAKKAAPRPRKAAAAQPAPPVTADPPKPISCTTVAQTGGRVKVVCQ